MNYYYYIAGMPDINQNNPKSIPDLAQIREELREELTPSDYKLFSLISYCLDDPDVKQYTSRFESDPETGAPIELSKDERMKHFYEYGMMSKNKFVHDWFEFNLNMNNVFTALICRNNAWSIDNHLVGNNNVTKTIRANLNVRDFGLKYLLDYFPSLKQVAETRNFMEREQKIDALKWQWLEENSFFKYFSIEKIISYYIRCTLLERWNLLTVEEGERVFREIINDLKKDVHF